MYFKFNPKYNPNRSRSRQTKSSDTSGGEQLQIDLILSVAGSRGEFIDGWLSSLSEYNPKIKWDIDELTGKSIISPTLLMFNHIEKWNLIS